MSATPEFPITGNHTFVAPLLTGDITKDGTGTVSLLAQAGSSGSYLYQIRVLPIGTTGTATLLRVFLNNNATPTVASNNTFLYEIALPVATASETVVHRPIVYSCDLRLKANYRLYCCLSTTVTGGWVPYAVMENF